MQADTTKIRQQRACLERMGIVVWERRSIADAVEPEPNTHLLLDNTANDASSAAASAPATAVENVVATAPSGATAKAGPPVLLSTDVQPDPSRQLPPTGADVLILRPALPDSLQTPVKESGSLAVAPDEKQLIQRMMDAINLSPSHWVLCTEASGTQTPPADNPGATVSDPLQLHQLIEKTSAVILILLLPAAGLANWSHHWSDDLQPAQTNPDPNPDGLLQLMVNDNRVITTAALCDPCDLLNNGALKRDAWECLKRVRQKLVLAGRVAADGS